MAENLFAAKPSEAIEAMVAAIEAGERPLLVGDPGIGKSDMVRQVAALMGFDEVIDWRAALRDPVDLRGVPSVEGGLTGWNPPRDLPQNDGRRYLLFLDEMNRGQIGVQNGLMQLSLDGRVAEYDLPPGTAIVAAINPNGVGTTQTVEALKSRFLRIDLVTDNTDWCKWGLDHGIEPMVIAYIRFKADDLHRYEPKGSTIGPNPRAWAKVSNILKLKKPRAIERILIAGLVGQEVALRFATFADTYRALPNLDALLLNPMAAPVPTEMGALYAVASALGRKATAANLGRVLQYLNRITVERQAEEFEVFAVRDAVSRDPSIAQTHEFVAWAIEHPND
jgi:MoxR-like ATPase